jgi:hypothetical protein
MHTVAQHPVEHEREQLPHRREREKPEVPDEQHRDRCNTGEGEGAVLPEQQEGANPCPRTLGSWLTSHSSIRKTTSSS